MSSTGSHLPGPPEDPARQPSRWRKWRRLSAWALFILTIFVSLGIFRLTKDPEPTFAHRHGSLSTLEVQSSKGSVDYRSELLRLTSSSGLSFEMALRVPLRPPGRLPLVVVLGGHRTGRDAIDLIPELETAAVAALSYPFDGEHRLKGLEVVAALPKIRRALLDSPIALSLALDHLLAQPWVDPSRVELVGISLGAPVACVAGARDQRFSRVWSIHGGARLRAMIDFNLREDFPSSLLRTPLSAFGGLLVAQLEPTKFVHRISPRPFVMINAEEDEKIPLESVEALFQAAREPKEEIWLPGAHIRPGRKEVVRELLGLVMERMERSTSADSYGVS
ncbi:MAG: hypothetical protein K0U98_25940 [Deltaproteobacteria bacterium]|nr:hypothetical protein [Deltaproteobacteria bacterium]